VDPSSSSDGGNPSSSSVGVDPSSSSGGGNSSSSSVGSGNGTTQQEAISLAAGSWAEGKITAASGEVWYKFNAAAGTTYYIWWNDSGSGPMTYHFDIVVTVYNSNGEILLDLDDLNLEEYGPQTLVLDSSGTVYFKVAAYSEYAGEGSFGIAYSTSGTMPSGSGNDIFGSCMRNTECVGFINTYWLENLAMQICNDSWNTTWNTSACPAGYKTSNYDDMNHIVYYGYLPSNATTLAAGVWTEGTATESGEVWYKFNAAAGTTYYIWWNDEYSGPATYDSDIKVTAYDSNREIIFEQDDINEDNPQPTIELDSSGTVYFKITAPHAEGSFGIAYNTSGIMP